MAEEDKQQQDAEPLIGRILSLHERDVGGDKPRVYTVRFNSTQPDQAAVEEAVELLGLFAAIEWPFHLHCDLRQTDVGQQMTFVPTYCKLIGKIANANCKACVVALPEGDEESVGRKLLVNTITFIVGMLGVNMKFDVDAVEAGLRSI